MQCAKDEAVMLTMNIVSFQSRIKDGNGWMNGCDCMVTSTQVRMEKNLLASEDVSITYMSWDGELTTECTSSETSHLIFFKLTYLVYD